MGSQESKCIITLQHDHDDKYVSRCQSKHLRKQILFTISVGLREADYSLKFFSFRGSIYKTFFDITHQDILIPAELLFQKKFSGSD